MAQIVSDLVVAPVVKFMASHITKHLGYVFCSTKHVTSMKDKLKDLVDTSTEVIEHKNRNETNNKEIPARVEAWLGDVEKVKDQVQSIPNDDIGCFHMKNRYRVGRNASKATMRIQELISKYSEITWTDAPLPTGRATSSTTSTPLSSSSGGDDFKSRDVPFNDALKLLQQDDNKSQVIALCGMGGVGKTTMMEQLKKVANDKKMFDFFVKVTLGRNPNMFSIQNDIGICIGGEGLREATVKARADTLQRIFERKLEDGKKKILVILDDVWEKVEIKDFGLTSPLPKGVKLLLTSRDSNICTQIADASLLQVVQVNVLSDEEAQKFFSEYTGVSKEHDHNLFKIGCDIVKKCGNLPLAIKLIGTTLKHKKSHVWRNTLVRLKNHYLDDNVQEIIRISYEYVKNDDDKEIFLHCGLFPEDSDIQIEDLVRHAWGLELFKDVSTLREARDRTETCVDNLVDANLLMHSEHLGCVKLHDLVLAFVLARVSKSWIVNHGDVSTWGRDEMNESCKRMSLTCMGMSEFPRDFKYPDLSFIQLVDGDQSLKFPEDLYASMENLKVIAFYKMQYPPLPTSLQFSTNLKSLCLHKCKLMSDWSYIGDLVNLEVLSLAYCGINKLPSKIGNLRKLKLLDLTRCDNLHIDDGVFINLVKLEELYMRCSNWKRIHLTDANLEELKILSCQLCALEVEFHDMNHIKDLSFEKLDKFKISIGCPYVETIISFKTTLQLNLRLHRSDLVDYKIHELVKKSESLRLSMKHMSHLEDFVPVNPYDQSFFLYLRDFHVEYCGNLKYLFPTHVTRGLRKLERLTISSCYVLEAVVHDYNGEINGKGEMIIFEELKYLSLRGLPKLVRLFPVDSVVELPQLVELSVDELHSITCIYPDNKNTSALQQALFNSQVRTSELKKVVILSMGNLERIWPSSSEDEFDNIPMLRDVRVEYCNELVNLFPTNPMRLLKHLEEITISQCSSLQEIFNIDLECFGEVEQVINISLRYIFVSRFSEEDCHVWSIKDGERNSSFHDFDTTGWVRKPYGTRTIYEQTLHQPSPNSIRLRRGRGNLGEASSGQAGADTRMKGKL
ncbi:putative P-loop containing nucleoside triphosphate hydrolase, leucine-rich repeat domain superfamily [Helianthus debilis subsp. tardiflorus]